MKVYLATDGSYSDFEVRRVFARREDAEAYGLSDAVHEFEVEEGPVETRPWYRLSWYPDEPDGESEHEGHSGRTFTLVNPREVWQARDYDGCPDRIEHAWRRCVRESGGLDVEGWDLDLVRRTFDELRTEWLNNKALGMVWDCDKLEWTAPEAES